MFDEFGFPGGAELDVAGSILFTFVYCSRGAEGVDDIRAVLQDALESAEDDHNVAALRRILEHPASGTLESLGRS